MTPPQTSTGRARSAAGLILPRLVGAFIVIWGAATLAFLVLQFVPGDPVNIMLGTEATASDALREQIRADMGLDQPVISQYFSYLGRVATFDLGESYRLQQRVVTVIGAQLVPTLQLAGLAIVFAVGLAALIALAARTRSARAVASFAELIAISSPTFWTGLLLLSVFSFRLHWFPVSGGQGFSGLVLPAITLALPIAGILSQVLRHGLDHAHSQPFVDSVRARGIGYTELLGRHTLRHASLPAVTLTAYVIGGLLGGAVIVEQLFARPGIGRVTLEAINHRDLPIVMALVVLAAAVFVIVNIIIDLLYPLLDPRLRRAT